MDRRVDLVEPLVKLGASNLRSIRVRCMRHPLHFALQLALARHLFLLLHGCPKLAG